MQNSLNEVILILVGSTVSLLVLAGLIVYSLLVSQRRKFAYSKKITDIQNAFEQEVLKTQLETQMHTLQTISQELHDNVGSTVSIAIVHLKSIVNPSRLDEATQNNIAESQKLLEEAMDILRDISRSINPDNIAKIGLSQAIQNEIDRVRRTKTIKAAYDLQGKAFEIPVQHQVIIFRIVQEAINNILKHSRASALGISLTFSEPHLEIAIGDNGQGFVVNDDEGQTASSGLLNMKKRAAFINGKLEISSKQNEGTEIRFTYDRKDLLFK